MSCCVCYCCVSNAQKVEIVMTNFGKISLLSQIENSEFPQFICGRILPVKGEVLVAPITGKKCVYYQTVVEELVEKSDSNGMLASEVGTDGKVWVGQIFETMAADFTLIDPAISGACLYVPGTTIRVRASIVEDDLNASDKGLCKTFADHETLPDHLMALLKRHNFDPCHHFKASSSRRNLRYREATFEFGEQVAVLGVVIDIVDDKKATKTQVLQPFQREVLTDDFLASKAWGEWGRRSLLDLSQEPCVIITDNKIYLQGIVLGAISQKMPLSEHVTTPPQSGFKSVNKPNAIQR